MQQGRKSLRIKNYDYSKNNWYFVTINVDRGEYLLGKIINGKMRLSKFGEIAKSTFGETVNHFSDLEINVSQVMPNHIHAVFIINHCRGGVSPPMGAETAPLQEKNATLGKIVGYYKYQSTKSINTEMNAFGKKFWQRNYWEHVIRSERELSFIQNYIINNPFQWQLDKYNFESTIPLKKRGSW